MGQEALRTARDLVARAPKNEQSLLTLGEIEARLSLWDAAETTFRHATDVAPDSARAHFGLAQVLIAKNSHSAAAEALDAALSRDPSLIAARPMRIESTYRAYGLEKALALAEAERREHPDNTEIAVALGLLYRQANRHVDSAGEFATVFAARPQSRVLRHLHRSLVLAGRRGEARQLLLDWVAEHPEDTDTRFFLATEQTAAGEYALAIAENEALLERQGERAALWNNLAWLFDQTGDARALEYAENAVALDPTSPHAADTLGWILMGRGIVDRALTLLKRAHRDAPDHPVIAYHYALALEESGHSAQAAAVLKRILERDVAFDERPKAAELLERLEVP